MIKIWTTPENIVLNRFLQTGTAALAAESLGRKWVGIEKDEKYAAIVKKRLGTLHKELVLAVAAR